MMLRTRPTLATILALLTVSLAVARKPGEPPKPGFNLFSKDQDIALGKEAAAQVRQQYQVTDNRELQDYVKKIGQKLVATGMAGDFPYEFTMVNDPSINAFALPGGPTFMHTGLLLNADNEAQIAGVVAHEISHVALRHGTNQASKANFLQLPALLVGVVTGSNLLAQLTQLGATGFLLKYSRTAESQADALGAQMMAAAGWNPVEMARFFEKLEGEGGARAPQFLSDHPNPGNRVKAVEEEVQALPRRGYDTRAGDFARMKALAQKMPVPKKNAQPGTSQNAPSPQDPGTQQQAPAGRPQASGQFKQLAGRRFALSHPDNWEVFGDPNSGSVTIAPRSGIVQAGNGSQIAYGAVTSYFSPRDNARSLSAANDQLIDDLMRSNQGMRLASRQPRRTRIDGSEALITQLSSQSALGGAETNMLLTVQRPEGIFYMVFIAPQKDYASLQRTFDQIAQSLRFTN